MTFKKNSSFDLYENVTQKILEKMERGVVPWQKPWDIKTGAPCNLATGKPYNGINIMLLGSQGYDSKYWLTFKQCIDKGGHVRKGEKGSMVVFWTFIDKTGNSVEADTDKDQLTKDSGKIPMLRFYTVFNANQCEGLDLPRLTKELEDKGLSREHEDIVSAQELIDQYVDRPEIKYGFTRACYRPSSDEVNMPNPEAFKGSEEYYSTLFHELVHSTGHETRLNRRNSSEIRVFGDEDYSKEELVAEMGASFLCARAGIENHTIDNSASYLASWMKALKDDKKLLITVAGQAQRAATYISEGLGREKVLAVSAEVSASRDLDTAVAEKRIPAELVEALRGPNFSFTDDEILPVVTKIAESSKSSEIAGYIVSGTINNPQTLDAILSMAETTAKVSKHL